MNKKLAVKPRKLRFVVSLMRLSMMMAIIVFGCNESENLISNPEQSGYLYLDFESSFLDSRLDVSLDSASSAIISIEDDEGNPVFSRVKFGINSAGSTDSIPLLPDNYLLTEVILTDSENNVLFATPLEDSELAYLVSDPLAISFTVAFEETLELNVEVLEVGLASSSQFGYGSSGFAFILLPTFDLPVVIEQYNDLTDDYDLVSGSIIVSDSSGEIVIKDLIPSVNIIKLAIGIQSYDFLVVSENDSLQTSISTDSLLSHSVESPLAFQFGAPFEATCFSFCLEPNLELTANKPDMVEVTYFDPTIENILTRNIPYEDGSCITDTFEFEFNGCGSYLNFVDSIPLGEPVIIKLKKSNVQVGAGILFPGNSTIDLTEIECPFDNCSTSIDPCTGSNTNILRSANLNTGIMTSNTDLESCTVNLLWYDPFAETDGAPFVSSNFVIETTSGDPLDPGTTWDAKSTTVTEIRPGLYTAELTISESSGADLDCFALYFVRASYVNNPGPYTQHSCIDLSAGCSGC